MALLLISIELILQVFASWTLAYQLALWIRLPARMTGWLCFLILLPLLLPSLGRWARMARLGRRELRFAGGTTLLGLGVAAFLLVASRPDNDDFFFFHRCLVQLRHPDQPFFLFHTGYNVEGLPPFSVTHIMTAYEPFIAFAAAALRLDPLGAYQNGAIVVGALLLCATYALLYREFRLGRRESLACAAAALLFLFLDFIQHRSFGTTTLLRLWQGKVMLWGLLVPMTFLTAHRFLRRPTGRNWLAVALAGICAVGLSGTGVFLMPFLILGCAMAYAGAYGLRRRVVRSLALCFAAFYPLVIGACVITGKIPQPADVSLWRVGIAADWWRNLQSVFATDPEVWRNEYLLILAPLLALRRPVNRFPVFLSLAFCVLFSNPVLGPFWLKKIPRAVFWRLGYLFPLPFCGGLLLRALTWHDFRGRTVLLSRLRCRGRDYDARQIHFALAALGVLLVLWARAAAAVDHFTPGVTWDWKAPWEYRLEPAELAFSRRITSEVEDRNVLAPERLACVLGLINSTVVFEATRGDNTGHTFRNAGRKAELRRRLGALEAVGRGERDARVEPALVESLESGVDRAIFRDRGAATDRLLAAVLPQVHGEWRQAERSNGYLLLVRPDSPPTRRL